MTEFTNRVVIVTGAFGTLGRAVAANFADQGATLALLDRSNIPEDMQTSLGARHVLRGGVQLTDESQTRTAIDEVAKRFNRIDVLVNVAGGFRWETIADGDIATWDALFAMNVKTALIASRAALPHLLLGAPHARIINIGAGAATRSAPMGMGAYTASKAAVQKLTESLADEIKSSGVTVNAVLPNIIDTPQNRRDMPDADFSKWVMPSAIADVIAFLASHRAAAITGAAIPINGRA